MMIQAKSQVYLILFAYVGLLTHPKFSRGKGMRSKGYCLLQESTSEEKIYEDLFVYFIDFLVEATPFPDSFSIKFNFTTSSKDPTLGVVAKRSG